MPGKLKAKQVDDAQKTGIEFEAALKKLANTRKQKSKSDSERKRVKIV